MIIIKFGENNVLGTIYINIYHFPLWAGGELHGAPYIFCLLFIKTENEQEHGLYKNQIRHHFDLRLFP